MSLIQQFKAAYGKSVPLIVIQTADPAATVANIRSSMNGSAPPILLWDIVRGVRSLNDKGKEILSTIPDAANKVDPIDVMIAAESLPEDTILFMSNMHRVIAGNGVSQAVWNLRDLFKVTHRCLVMLCPSIDLPVEIQQDVMVLDEPLPDNAQLEKIVADIYKSAQQSYPDMVIPEDLSKPVGALSGLAAFPAEQSCAVSLTRKGINQDWLWERKRRAIEATKGLAVHRGNETFDQIGGCENIKQFLMSVVNGKEPPLGIVFQDEIEKQVAGAGGDTSGVSGELHGIQLSWMQDHRADGSIFIGPPGAAKSVLAKAFGNTAGVPTIVLDTGAMKSSLVGDSGANFRQALKVIHSISQGRTYFVATCNSIEAVSPELRRRFKSGIFFFDLPTADERKAIWKIYFGKYKLDKQQLPNDANWTGAEIEQACSLSWKLNVSLIQAANYIVPVAKSDAERIKRLRQQADGKFISASYSGVYQLEQQAETGRRIEL
jgi:hypothetical protein